MTLIKYNVLIIPQKHDEVIKEEVTKIHKQMIQDILKNKGLLTDGELDNNIHIK